MADEDKEKAEKLAAAKKRFEQLKKQKAKKDKAAKKNKEEEEDKSELADGSTPANDEPTTEPSVAGDAIAEPGSKDPDDVGTADATDAPIASEAISAEPAADNTEAETDTNARSRPQLSLSEQSRMRSESFKRGVSPPSLPSGPMSPSGADSVTDIYKKQATRIELLERENKQLETDAGVKQKTLDRIEKELEELRDAQADVVDLKLKAGRVGEMGGEVDKLKSEITSLQRQNAQLQSQVNQNRRRASSGTVPTLQGTEDLHAQIATKANTIESLELELSNLRYSVTTLQSENATLSSRITTLQSSLAATEASLKTTEDEMTTLRASGAASPSDASTAADVTRMQLLTRDLTSAQAAATDATARAANLEKKIEALTTLHRESEARNLAAAATRNKEVERLRGEASEMRTKVVSMSSENARLRANSVNSTVGGHDLNGEDDSDDADPVRRRLQTRVRQLEGEIHELRSGVWRDRRIELQGEGMEGEDDGDPRLDDPGMRSPHSIYDDVDLNASVPPTPATTRARTNPYGAFTNVLNAITGAGPTSPGSNANAGTSGRRQSMRQQGLAGGFFGAMAGIASGEGTSFLGHSNGDGGAGGGLNEDDDDDFAFDEDAFRKAQEEEAKKRLERVRETKRGLKSWEGWRVDMVDVRGGSAAGVFDL